MKQTQVFRYAGTSEYQAVELPLEGDRLVMTIYLPKHSLTSLIRELAKSGLAATAKKLTETEVDLTLPRFRTTASFSLVETLAAMGMPTPFDAARADFSGITTDQDLYISGVEHKAYVNVDEQGTEAAAATAVIVGTTGAIVVPRHAQMVVDRPFLFTISDQKTGAPLFLGRITDPRKK
jgi:serpin B